MTIQEIDINRVIVIDDLETVVASNESNAYFKYENNKRTDEICGYKYYVSDGRIRELMVKVPGRLRDLGARVPVRLVNPRISYVYNNGEIVVTADDILNNEEQQ